MVLATYISRLFRSFMSIVWLIVLNPWLLIKISFVWFFVTMAVTYGYFIWTHQDYIASVRKTLALSLMKSLCLGFVCTTALVGLYEYSLNLMCRSKLFMASVDAICHLSLTQEDPVRLFKVMSILLITFNALWAYHYIEPLLAQWHEKHVVEGYGWLIIGVSLICFGFLWSII